MTLDPEPVLFIQALVASLKAGTAIEDIEFRVGRLEREDAPPVALLESAGELRLTAVSAYLPARVQLTTYGRTEDEALLLYRTTANLLHRRGPVVLDGVGAWRIFDETGPQPREDPDTNWSARTGTLDVYMPDVALNTGTS